MESFLAVGKSLPPKEATLIKQVMRLIDNKKYSKALKKVEKVLLVCPEDGDSLSLKGNILNCLGKKEEALTFSKQGVMKNLKSALSWHTLSQVYYNDRNYTEAYKAEQKAFGLSSTNNSIIRGLSLLQLHMRDYQAFRDSRKQILLNNFTGMINWISYAVAEHFCGARERAVTILESFLKSMEKQISKQELSETLLYKARILEEMNKFPEMLEVLLSNKDKIRDTPTWHEFTVRAALGAENFEEASRILTDLIQINSENPLYFKWYFQAKQLSSEEEKLQGLADLKQQYPKSTSIEREELNLLHENIISKFHPYIIKRVRKGIPSIFSDIKSLLHEESRGRIILEYVKANVESLKTNKSFLDAENKLPSEKIEQPQCLMWMLYLCSQILDHYKFYDEALGYIKEAIDHTPTVPDFYLFIGKVYKHLGILDKAAESNEEGRCLDLGDRYLNNKSAKYLLRNNQIAKAEEVMALFSKEKVNELNVHDMQSMWFELELAEAYFRLENYSKAADEFKWIEKHIMEMFEDQYDFHFYCFRKMNLNSYSDFMVFEDSLIKNKNFLRAGIGLVKIYFKDSTIVSQSEASRLLKLLLRHHKTHIELNTLGFTVFLQKEKYLLCLRSLDKLRKTQEFSDLRESFIKQIQEKQLKEVVQQVIQRVLNR